MYYQNRFQSSKEMAKEYVNKVLCYSVQVRGIIVICLCVLCILVGLVLRQGNWITMGGVFLITSLATFILTPRKVYKQFVEYDKKLYGDVIPETIVTFGENIKTTEGNNVIEIEYDQIIAWYKLKTHNLLMFTKENGIMYVDNGFVGDAQGFEAFIMGRCKNLKKVISR